MNQNARKICLQRMFCSSIWNLILQSMLIGIYLFFININIFHPMIWLSRWFNCAFNWETWFYFFPLIAVIAAQGLICAKDYITLQPFYPTRFSLVVRIFSLHNLIICFLHIFIGYLTVWLYLSVSKGEFYSFVSSNNTLNEERLFLTLSGSWVNLHYFLKAHFSGGRHLIFPVIQQPKFAQIKSQLFVTVKGSLPEVLLPNCLFIIIYYLKGGMVREFTAFVMGLEISEVKIDTFEGIFNLKILAYLWFLTTTVVSSMKLMEFLYRIYLTERQIFPIFNCMLPPGTMTLEEVLKLTEFPFLHHLAFLDLFMLSECSKSRRAHIFTLSQPGGHPHTWNSVKDECFKTIDMFNESLADLLIFRQKKETAKETFTRYGVPDNTVPSIDCHKPPPAVRKVTFLDVFFNKIYEYFSGFSNWIKLKMAWLNSLPIIIYLFGDRKDLKIKHALRQAQLVLWACNSLSYLTVHSLIEDKFGIVQNDLPKIICSLLKLHQTLECVEKHVSYTVIDPCATSRAVRITKNKLMSAQALNKSIKRSIYRISNAFKDYISDLQLPRDAETQMLLFSGYKV